MSRRIRKLDRAQDLTLDEIFTGFISEKMLQGKSKPTLKAYTYAYLSFCECEEIDGETFLCNRMQRHYVYDWIVSMQSRGISNAGVNHYIKQLRVFLYWAQTEQYMEVFDIETIPEQEQLPKLYEQWEIDKLIEPPKNKNDFVEVRTYTMICLILNTGFRRETVCELKMEDIDWKERMITASHTKNKQHLALPMTTSLTHILREYINDWRYNAKPADYVFCQINGERLDGSGCRSAYVRYCKKRGVNTTNIHSLRHQFATNMVIEGADAFTIKQVLGHSSITTSERYIHLMGEDIKEGFDRYSMTGSAKNRPKKTIERRKR